jgi:glycosyltransferase involved in cell wall biosynthesis
VELARHFTDRVLTIPWEGFGPTKNLAIAATTRPWIFVLDADERITPLLRREIEQIVQADGPLDGYRVPRRNHFCGRFIKYLGWYPDYSIRLFRKSKGRFSDREVHESVEINGRVGTLHHPMLRMDRYSTLAAQELLRRGKRPLPGELVWRPVLTFLRLYFLKKGLLAGRDGYTLAFLYSTYNFLKYYKFRELRRKSSHEGVPPA